MKTTIDLLSGLLLAIGTTTVCTGAEEQERQGSSRVSPEMAEQYIREQRPGIARESDFVKELAASISRESRNKVWANEKEESLRKSFAALTDLPEGALKDIDCRSSRCELRVETTAAQSLEASVEQQYAIDQWAAWSQPCAYTMLTEIATLEQHGEIRIFLNCGEEREPRDQR